MTDFLALYRGRTVAEAELVAVTAEPRLVRKFFSELLDVPEEEQLAKKPEHEPQELEAASDK